MKIRLWGVSITLMIVLVAVVGRAGGRAEAAPTSCAAGFALLSEGSVTEAERVFLSRPDEPSCQDGLALIEPQRQRAHDLADACDKAADELADESDDQRWSTKQAEMLATCGEAVHLDRAQADVVAAALAKAPTSPPGEPTSAERADKWWSGTWSRTQDVAVSISQGLLLVALALPLLNALGIALGRQGPIDVRRRFSRSRPHRLIAATALVVCLVLALSGQAWWITGIALLVGALAVAVTSGLFYLPVLVLAVLLGGGIVFGAIGGEGGEPWLDVAIPVVAFVLLAWVLAQRRRVRVESFTKPDGTTSATIAPLVATELVNLARPRGGGVDVVDALAVKDLDSDAVSVLSGPENKVVSAAIQLFRTFVQTGTDWVVSGQLIGDGTSGTSLAIQLKYGRGTIAATVIGSRTYTSSTKRADGSGKASPDHNELAHPAAAWILIELLNEYEGGDLSQVSGMDGATIPRALSLYAAATRAQRKGDDAGAIEFYARAIDADPNNLLARLGFAIIYSRTGEDEEREVRIQHLVNVVGTILAEDGEASGPGLSIATRLLALHARLVATLNLISSRAKKDGAVSDDDAERLVLVRHDIAELNSLLGARQPELMASTRLAFESSLASLEPICSGQFDEDWLTSSRNSTRAAYNAACLLTIPLVQDRQPGDEQRAIDLLRFAVSHPAFRRLAKKDPSLEPLKDNEDFKALVAEPEPDTDGLMSIDVIGKDHAKALAKINVTTFDAIAAASTPDLAEATQAPPQVIALWRNLADVEAIDGIGIKYTNLLFRCGVRSRAQLAVVEPRRLASIAAGIAPAAGVEQPPSASMVARWSAIAGGRPVPLPDEPAEVDTPSAP